MPKPDPAPQETEEPEVTVVPSEETNPAEVEVNLEPQKAGDAAPDPTEKLRNQMFYEMRQQEKRIASQHRKMMEEFYQRMAGPKPAQTPGSPEPDEFEQEVERIAQTDWRKAVDMRAERIAQKKYDELLKKQQAEAQQTHQRESAMRIEARGRDKVVSEFPNIMDESSPEFKAYMEIYNREAADDPVFVYNPRKHEIILPELREKMKGGGPAENPEISRLRRVAAGSFTPSRPAPESKTIMLTQEEIAMCKRSGVPIETYAKNKKLGQAGFKEGVVLDD